MLYLKFLFFILLFFCFQCKDERNIDDKTKKNIVQENNNIPKDSLSYAIFENMPYEDLVQKYFDKPNYRPVKETTFIMGVGTDGYVSEFRVGLFNFFSEKEIQEKDIIIKEVTWKMNENNRLTIWYKRDNKKWIPIDRIIYDKHTDF